MTTLGDAEAQEIMGQLVRGEMGSFVQSLVADIRVIRPFFDSFRTYRWWLLHGNVPCYDPRTFQQTLRVNPEYLCCLELSERLNTGVDSADK